MQSHPSLRELNAFNNKRAISFPSSIFNSLKNDDATTTMDMISEMGIDVFDYERLQFAIDYDNDRSLFVVTHCALVEMTYFNTDQTRWNGIPTTG